MSDAGPIVHIAGIDLTVDTRMRQRCSWCGALLIDYDLTRVMVPADQPGPPPVWPVTSMVAVDGNLKYTVAYTYGDRLPEGSCTRIDPEVTS